ncbi:MAG: hypothetical protein B6I31_04335 [Desulfobacteraceae bacterium 4572_19]|nr:MAG: hypothetical protein B6I31_04335 [Desulfobacteraceae bacterium 4572_19]
MYEAAILHDIGIFRTNAPGLDCNGNLPYICHGYIGRDIMEQLGYPKHALICERHVGTGITTEDIKKNKLPLPVRNMMPETLEEKIICYADKFYSKEPNSLTNEKSVESIIKELQQFGNLQVARFYKLMELLHFA